MHIPVTEQFVSSYRRLETYPENIDGPNTYLPSLQSYKRRLDGSSEALFNDVGMIEVPFRDLDASGGVVARRNVRSDPALREHLGDTAVVDAQGRCTSSSFVTKPDPKCRFIFLHAKNSRAPLRVTRKMLTRILSYHQVMPKYLEFLFLFGSRTTALDMRYSGFREQAELSTFLHQQEMLKLGRSGRRYQLCFNLKTVNLESGEGTDLISQDWHIRQAAMYHSMDIVSGTTVWIVTKGNLELKKRIEEVTGADGRPQDRAFGSAKESFRSSLAIHTMLAHWASEDWRWYIQWLERMVEQETLGTVTGIRTYMDHHGIYTVDHLQDAQILEERAIQATMIIDANCTVLAAIQEFYDRFGKKSPFNDDVADEVDLLSRQLKDAISDLRMQSQRSQLLFQIISQRKVLVVQYLQGQAAAKMEQLTAMSQREAIAMRIITVVALIYLPATFVSTFFSTDIVKYQDGGSNLETSYSPLAMYRWLQVTLPLTFITLLIAWVAYMRAWKSIPLRVLFKQAWADVPLLPMKEPRG